MNRKQRRAASKRQSGSKDLVVGAADKAARHQAEGREVLLTLGKQLHEEGRLESADRYYVQALQADPNDAEALRLRGALAHQIGNHSAAVELLKRAAARLPNSAEVRLHWAASLEALGDLKGAERLYRKAVALDPSGAATRTQLGAFLRLSGKAVEAERELRAAREADPGAAAPAYHLAALFVQQGRSPEALAQAEAAHAIAPDDLDILTVLGVARQHGHDYQGAEQAFRAVDAHAPGNLSAAINLSSLLIAQNRGGEAEESARAALAADPDSVPAMINLGVVLAATERFAEGEALYRDVLARAPDYAEGWGNYANLLRMAGRHEEADAQFDKALSLDPTSTRALFQKGMGLLALGQLDRAWALYEHGFACGERRASLTPKGPRWDGAPLGAGESLHIWPEQGVGDEIRFLGLVAAAAARAKGPVAVECDARLVPLAARSLPMVEVRAPAPDPAPDPDDVAGAPASLQCPMGSLAGIVRTDLLDFPDHGGYLQPDPSVIADFQERLAALGPGLKIGIAWRSGLVTLRRQGAHGSLDAWGPLLSMAGVQFVALQYGDVEEEVRAAEAAHAITIARWDDLDLKQDLDRVAGLIGALDLVITTGSSVADLTGAVGTPLWALYRTRDWSLLGQDTSPWYPRARIFQRPAGESWDHVIAQDVAPALAERLASRI